MCWSGLSTQQKPILAELSRKDFKRPENEFLFKGCDLKTDIYLYCFLTPLKMTMKNIKKWHKPMIKETKKGNNSNKILEDRKEAKSHI